uniref:Uncharacterized protein n=1 Tax=Brassica oleracea TaxID=3712 RepID=A0A3P6HDC2_BRAOL|nr:unnamed protein product [Brassica oleracea]
MEVVKEGSIGEKKRNPWGYPALGRRTRKRKNIVRL